jgi:hypothetical protein
MMKQLCDAHLPGASPRHQWLCTPLSFQGGLQPCCCCCTTHCPDHFHHQLHFLMLMLLLVVVVVWLLIGL